MKASIVPIGNSKGIRIPKTILEQCNIKKEVELEVKDNIIIIKSLKKEVRKDWEDAFKKMHDLKEDRLLIDDNIDLDMENWEW